MEEVHQMEVVLETAREKSREEDLSDGTRSYCGALIGNREEATDREGKKGMEVEEDESNPDKGREDLEMKDNVVDPCLVIKISKEEHEEYSNHEGIR